MQEQRNGNDKYFCEDICLKCELDKYGCWPEFFKVGTGYDDKGNGIITTCSGYEKAQDEE